MTGNKQIMDGCTAAAHVAYALSDLATIYPITPIASMGDTAGRWAMQGRVNIWGRPMEVKEMESELGAAGATHGAAAAGALATTFTASQGLLLMIPNMFKIAGELLPAVFHVGTRSLATHALSIFGDHQDIMATRSTGFAFLASASVQETMDLALVAHLAAIDGSLPVVHFFDGWRTSNEMDTISAIPYETIASLVDADKVRAIRDRGMNPCHPDLRGSAQNPDVYFQNREAANRYYDAFPDVVQAAMDRVGRATGRRYRLFDYFGHPQPRAVVVAMGSGALVAADTAQWLNSRGYRVGVVAVRLFRPFSAAALLQALPQSVTRIAVLDRTKEPGSNGEPLFQDVAAAVLQSGRPIQVIGGRYGLSSKEFNPAMVKAVFDNLLSDKPLSAFTVGIDDDVTHLSLPVGEQVGTVPADTVQCLFYGMGSDGTVGACKQAAAIIGGTDGLYAQAYFHYSAKKSGGYTKSELRFARSPIRAAYAIQSADYIGCNKNTYVKRFNLLDVIKPGGVFVLNSAWNLDSMDKEFPASLKRAIARKKVRFYNIDAFGIAARTGLGVRINTIMQTVFFRLTGVIPFDRAIDSFKKLIAATYMHEGGEVVRQNYAAIDAAAAALRQVPYPDSWADAADAADGSRANPDLPAFVRDIAVPCNRLMGDGIPVSALDPAGIMPMGTTAYEKRCIAINVPEWNPDKCVQCTLCSLCCPHAAIRPVLADAAETGNAPAGFATVPAREPELKGLAYRIQVYPADCTGCSSCATVCPGHALTMKPIDTQLSVQSALLDYCQKHVAPKQTAIPRFTVKGSQLHRPLLQFSGACAGCGETPYVKLLTQLFGERLIIANATGCSSIWGANFPSNAYCTLSDGRGPAWGNSLFEDNAEYGFGIASAIEARRRLLAHEVSRLAATAAPEVKAAAQAWLDAIDNAALSQTAGDALVALLRRQPATPLVRRILQRTDMLGKKSVWAVGGDGWAYDIGFAGLDHVLAQNIDINLMVLDTECYSNTGGQTSKATPMGAVMKYAADGKRTYKKDLGRMMMTYGTIYVAQIALGANYQQAVTALAEAEAFDGPSIVICYCPCINHGIRRGMGYGIFEERDAVRAGYWQLYRYNPSQAAQGKEPLTLDSAAPDGDLVTYINGENRYADLRMADPAEAAILQPALARRETWIYGRLRKGGS